MNKELRSAIIVGAVFAVCALVAFFFVLDTSGQLEDKQAELAALEEELTALDTKGKELPGLQEQLASVKANLSQYIKILPSPDVATDEELVRLVQEKSARAQFQIDQITVEVKGKKGKSRRGKPAESAGAFEEIGLNITGQGTFDQFLRFLNSLERHESFLRVNTFSITAPSSPAIDDEGRETWPLRVQLQVSTYRYKAEEPKAKKKKG
jgi:Tfp pilus assembly protein PilO